MTVLSTTFSFIVISPNGRKPIFLGIDNINATTITTIATITTTAITTTTTTDAAVAATTANNYINNFY